jgi:hypothetical protein
MSEAEFQQAAAAAGRVGQEFNLAHDPFMDGVVLHFRCAVCGVRVGRRGKDDTIEMFERVLVCSTHGELADPTFGGMRDEWTRRGKPASLNLRLPPVQ